MSQHNILSPSTAHRWLHCHGSVLAALGVESESSEFADEGTAAHTLAAWALREKRDTVSYIGTEIPVLDDDGKVRSMWKVDEDMASYVQVYVDAIRDRTLPDTIVMIEQRVTTALKSVLYGSVAGTADAALAHITEKVIDVCDLKYGRGVRVEADGNPQLRIYGLGVIEELRALIGDLDGWKVRLSIHQPRLDHFSEEVLTIAELLAWGESAQREIDHIDEGDEKLTPTEDGCRFCPIKASCPALAKFTMDSVFSEFKETEIPDLSDWGLSKALEKIELVEQWCKSIRDAAFKELEAGRAVTGWKLVEGRQGARKWIDEAEAEKTMRASHLSANEMFESKLRSPTQMEKVLKGQTQTWEKLQGEITRAPASKALARDTDPRPAVNGDVKGWFK